MRLSVLPGIPKPPMTKKAENGTITLTPPTYEAPSSFPWIKTILGTGAGGYGSYKMLEDLAKRMPAGAGGLGGPAIDNILSSITAGAGAGTPPTPGWLSGAPEKALRHQLGQLKGPYNLKALQQELSAIPHSAFQTPEGKKTLSYVASALTQPPKRYGSAGSTVDIDDLMKSLQNVVTGGKPGKPAISPDTLNILKTQLAGIKPKATSPLSGMFGKFFGGGHKAPTTDEIFKQLIRAPGLQGKPEMAFAEEAARRAGGAFAGQRQGFKGAYRGVGGPKGLEALWQGQKALGPKATKIQRLMNRMPRGKRGLLALPLLLPLLLGSGSWLSNKLF